MRFRRAYLIPALALVMSGCVTQPQMVWYHNSNSQEQAHAHWAECMALGNVGAGAAPQVQRMEPARGWNPEITFAQGLAQIGAQNRWAESREEIFQYCMMGKGYYLAPVAQ